MIISEEEPEFEHCHIERQIPEKTSQPIVSTDMTPLAQSNLEHGQENVSSDFEHVDTPVDHASHNDIQQGSMAPPRAISSDQLIDPHMSLDPKFLVPIEETVEIFPNSGLHICQVSTLKFFKKIFKPSCLKLDCENF